MKLGMNHYSTIDGFMRGLKTKITSDEREDMDRNRTNSSRSITVAISFHSSAILLQTSSSSSSSSLLSSPAQGRSCFDTTILRWPLTAGSSGPPGAGVVASLSDSSSLVVDVLWKTRLDFCRSVCTCSQYSLKAAFRYMNMSRTCYAHDVFLRVRDRCATGSSTRM